MRGLAPAALLAAAVLSGCGANAVESAPPLDEVAAATRSDSYRFEVTLTSEGLLEDEKVEATGASDPAGERGFVHYSFEEFSYELRQVEAETYVRLAAPGSPENGWRKESTGSSSVLAGPLGALSHPHDVADTLARHGRDVAAGPGEPIDGDPTTHYRGTVSTVELFGRRTTGAEREQLEEEIRQSRSESTRFEAWAGPDRALRRLELTIPLTEAGRTGRVLATVRFFDFGRPVEVQAPPASVVVGPCPQPVAPHTAEAVIEGLAEAGYRASASCDGDETIVVAVPERRDGDQGNDVVMCFVKPSLERPENGEDLVVDGNVACAAEPSQRARVRAALAGL